MMRGPGYLPLVWWCIPFWTPSQICLLLLKCSDSYLSMPFVQSLYLHSFGQTKVLYLAQNWTNYKNHLSKYLHNRCTIAITLMCDSQDLKMILTIK